MPRPITLCTAQWADLPLEETCKVAREMGYDGLELAAWGQIDVHKAVKDPGYVQRVKDTLAKYGMGFWAIAAHVAGQCVCDNWDVRLNGFAPAELANKPDEIRVWAAEEMKTTARAAQKLGVKVVTGFMGSPIWKFFYSFPQTSEEMIEQGFQEIKRVWNPVLDVFDECGVKFALEVHPSEIAFDYYTAKRLLETFEYRPALGLNFDPSHLVWQGINPVMFLEDFHERVYHVHAKDVAVNLNGRNGILGSHLPFGDVRRGWNFVSLGHGDVDFDDICRVLNQYGYTGPLSVEWEDSGMDRVYGATEALQFLRKHNFDPSAVAFDATLKSEV